MPTVYVTAAFAAVLAIAAIVLAAALGGLKKDISLSRMETAQTVQNGLSELNRTMSENTLEQDRRMEYLRATVENRMNSLQSSNAAQLDSIRGMVDEKLQNALDDRLSRSFSQVRQSLDEVYRGLGEMQTLAQGVGDLRRILTNVKSRGVIGELQLGAILGQFMAPSQYEQNVQVRPDTQQRVEFAVKLPGSGDEYVWLPIDSKFPGDIYARLQDAYENADPAGAEECRKLLSSFIRSSAKEIREKYVAPPHTTEFAVMFLPFEGLYAEVVNMGLMELCQNEYRIMISGPSTMAAMLSSLQLGFRTLAIQKHSGEVWKVLGAVKTEFDKFADVLAQTQSKLNQANSELDKLIGVRTRSIQRTLESVHRAGGLDEPDMGDS